MKSSLSLFASVCVLYYVAGCTSPRATAEVQVPVSSATGTTASVAAPTAPADEMEQLVAPIALYPDVLVALILPAATESSDVVLAARFLANGGTETSIDAQPWDDSVKGLARYPEVVKWMDQNLSWTQQIGEAYLDHPEDVMAAVQHARARAMAKGLLTSTAQQQVIVEDGNIRIVPAQPNAIYVPRYDPQVIYVERPVLFGPDPWLTFGASFSVGWWLHNDCDWHRRVIVVDRGGRDHGHDGPVGRHPGLAHRPDFGRDSHWRPWTPPAGRPVHHEHNFAGRRPNVVHPLPIAEGPQRDEHGRQNRPDNRPDNHPPFHRADRVPAMNQPKPALNAASAAAAMPAPANVRPNPVGRERPPGSVARHNSERENEARRSHFRPVAAPPAQAHAPAPIAAAPRANNGHPVAPANVPVMPHRTFTPNRSQPPQVAATAPAPTPRVQAAPPAQQSAPAFSPHVDRPGGGYSRGGGNGGHRDRPDRADR